MEESYREQAASRAVNRPTCHSYLPHSLPNSTYSFKSVDGGVGNDELDGAGGGDEAFGGAGTDDCNAYSDEHTCGVEENPPGDGPIVILNQGLDGSSLIVQGDGADDHIRVSFR